VIDYAQSNATSNVLSPVVDSNVIANYTYNFNMAFDGSSEIAVDTVSDYSIFTVVEDSVGNLGVGKNIQLYKKEFFLDDSTVPTSDIIDLDASATYTTPIFNTFQTLFRDVSGLTQVKYPINVQESFSVSLWRKLTGSAYIQFGNALTTPGTGQYIKFDNRAGGRTFQITDSTGANLLNNSTTATLSMTDLDLFFLSISYDKPNNTITFLANNTVLAHTTLPTGFVSTSSSTAYLIFEHDYVDDVRIYNEAVKGLGEFKYISYTRGYPVIPEFIQTIVPAKPGTQPVVTGQSHARGIVAIGVEIFTNRTSRTISSFSSTIGGGYFFKFENEVNFSASATITFYEPTLLYLCSMFNQEYSHPENFTDDFTEFWYYDKEAPKIISVDFLDMYYHDTGITKIYKREFPAGTSQLRINGQKTVLYTFGPP
jgi:hypothetical protein